MSAHILKRAATTASALAVSLLLAQPALASPIELVTNGGFETGDLSAWSRSSNLAGSCPSAGRDWNVSTSGSATGCYAVANPSGSTYAAYVMNDGPANTSYKLYQDIFIPLGAVDGSLSFRQSSMNTFDNTRKLSVRFLDGSSGDVLATVFDTSTFSRNSAWTLVSNDISAFLASHAGQTVRLEFDNSISRQWTGQAGLGLDDVSLLANVNAVPEPASVALMGLGILGLAAARRKRKA